MSSQSVFYYGHEEPPPAPQTLRAGPLTLCYDQGDLRDVRLDGRLLLLRLYAAVRDRNWGTVPAVLTLVTQEIGPDSFRIVYNAEHCQEDIHFVWRGTLTGESDGTITFDFEGEAKTTFARSRIGFCILHPAECAGAPCTVTHVDGTSSHAPLPEYIASEQPVSPFIEMRALTVQMDDGLRVRVDMEGDIFEMEDQRNWTDASYKTFCTPLRLPYPVEIAAGTRVRQKVTLRVEREEQVASAEAEERARGLRMAATGAAALPLPALGLGATTGGALPDAREAALLRALRPAHLRVDLRLAEPGWEAALERGMAEAQALGAPLEAGLLLPDAPSEALHALRARLDTLRPSVARWLVLPAFESPKRPPPYPELLAATRESLGGYAPGVLFAAGTDSDFFFLNRFPPPAEACAMFAFSINPQVHAFDNASLMETLAAQAAVVNSARRLADGKPVVVSPVTLLPRWNPYAANPLPRMTPPADPRQRGLFGAAWTLGSLKYLAESGAASATYYETVGPGGVMEEGRVSPLYHVLADVGEFAGGAVLPSRSSDDLQAAGLLLQQGDRRRFLIANLTSSPQEVTVADLSAAVTIRLLDETNAEEAMHAPDAFRAQTGTIQATESGAVTLNLRPFAIARIDSLSL